MCTRLKRVELDVLFKLPTLHTYRITITVLKLDETHLGKMRTSRMSRMSVWKFNPRPDRMKLSSSRAHKYHCRFVLAPERRKVRVFFCEKNTGISLRNSRYLAQDNSGVCEKEKRERKIVCVKLSIYTNKLVGAYFFSPHHVVPALLLLLLCVGSLWSQFFGFGCFFPNFFFASSFSLRSEVLQMQ